MAVSRLVNRIIRRDRAPLQARDDLERPDFEQQDMEIIRRVAPFTMTSPERIYALIKAVEYIVHRSVPGALLECGVWRGGSMMAAALTLLRARRPERDLYLFDTFEGMPPPTTADVDLSGRGAGELLEGDRKDPRSLIWAYAPEEEVRINLESIGFESSRLHFVKGKVEETLPASAPAQIALLRLDTDWYESTSHALKHLYPRLEPGGVLIVDDYGHWRGARQAVDEYFADPKTRPLLVRVDYTGRLAVK